jgi:hypothetical protein
MEESQHAKLDTLIIEAMREACREADVDRAIAEYGQIGALLDRGLMQQVQFDLEAFEEVSGRRLNESERREFTAVQSQAVRWTYLGSGMTHPNFLATVDSIKPAARTNNETMSPAFC